MDAAPPLLSARGLAVARAERQVLAAVDLDLRPGEIVAVLGPNGAGKSTLLAALAGLLPASAGTIDRHGRVAAALQSAALARRTARANVEAALGWWGVPREQRRDRADAALDALGALQLAERQARGLSGGEQRRVHLARVLALASDVLLLDEPFSGLDAEARADLLYAAASALRDPGRATLVVVHDRAEAWALADRVLILIDGRVVADGPLRRLLDEPPSPAVARFLGFDGQLTQDGRERYLRPAHVHLDPAGPIEATVTRRVPLEDGVRLDLDVPGGHLVAHAPAPGPGVGERIRVRTDPGASFPAAPV